MKYWVIPDEMAAYDRRAIENGTPADVLMERAGEAVARRAMKMVSPDDGFVIVFAGPGNNGGDGLVAARKLRERSYYAHVVLATERGKSLSPECQNNLTRFVGDGGIVIPPEKLSDLTENPVLLIDALLGTGFKGEIGGVFAQCLNRMHNYHCRILAVDTPSGVNCRTGEADPLTLAADVTVTMAAPKAGLLLPPGCGYAGAVFVADIGIPVNASRDRMVPEAADIPGFLPERPVDGHKGTFGKVLLVGGSEIMSGAPQLMARGAVRSGVGLVTLTVPISIHQLVAGRIPEALCSYFLPGDPSSLPDPSGYDAVAVGPGMGDSLSTTKIVNFILENWQVPLVLDADALNVLGDPRKRLKEYRGPILLTPHPGELSRLCDCDPSNLPERSAAAAKLAAATGTCILLKGRPTMVFQPERGTCLVPAGNDGMATGGSGDVLTGITASFLAQGMDPFDAAVSGAFLHGLAGDMAVAEISRRSLAASDISLNLGRAFDFVENIGTSELLTSGGKWHDGWMD